MTRPCVLVFAGSDPSGGAGIQADIEAIGAMEAHALPVITAITVQDNNRVYGVHPVDAQLITDQAQALLRQIPISAVKIGILGNRDNALAIAAILAQLKQRQPKLPIVLDPVLASGNGDALASDDAMRALEPLFEHTTLLTPNIPEATSLCSGNRRADSQAEQLMERGCQQVLIKGGHGQEATIINRWYSTEGPRSWSWQRLGADFHGSGCTLAAAIAALMARGFADHEALYRAQMYCHNALVNAFQIADGQLIPERFQ